MSEKKKMGRPIVGNPKDIRLEVRVDKPTLDKLDKLAKKEKCTRAEVIRRLIAKA